MTMSMSDPGLQRALDSLDKKIDGVARHLDSLDNKVDAFIVTSVSKAEFQAYKDLRRTTTRWAVGIIISVLVLASTVVGVILSTH